MASSRPSGFALTSAGPLRLFSTNELLRLPPPEWLIEGILPVGGFTGLYGPSNCGKSFLALDIALSVASGTPWQGHVVNYPGSVLYIAAEGGPGIQKRVRAWLEFHQLRPEQPRIAWLIETAEINNDSGAVDILLERIEKEVLRVPVLIVVDTLARCLEGDENTQLDMGRFIAGVDRLRHEWECAAIVIHHTRLDESRERGNTAFRGAVDTMLSVSKPCEGSLIVECTKQRDAEHFKSMEFTLRPIGATESCTVAPMETGGKEALREILQNCSGKSMKHAAIMSSAKIAGTSKRSLNRALVALTQNGEIIKEKGEYRLAGGVSGAKAGTELSR